MNKLINIKLIMLGCMAYGLTSAASFDCSKASTITEKTICNNPALSTLDDKLSEAYKNAKSKTSDEAKLKAEQIAWIKESRKCGGDSNCLEKTYKDRITYLIGSNDKNLARVEKKDAPPTQSTTNAAAQPSKTQPSMAEMNAKIAGGLGPEGWGKCVAANIALTSLSLRDKTMPSNIVKANENLGFVLGEVRQYFLSKGVPDSMLGSQIKAWSPRMTSGDYALETATNCLNIINNSLASK